ncbi:thiol:disulfide interchange protein [Actinobacillus delphinicola]|uniref:Periplasmic protein thiol--disulfide oxidoreductase DsbE n=1 Tax=Actinobacillus delphinicola TaxID=51161 RepID=A0A448TUE7_9PAST|nr:DsbE family thiol:disulfide interchange protein [Actinobacillus delphinicola]MDG6897740.1 thiol:disulfide interchange protein [Actinobacillus delphinicola]VEJ09622.1 periplasmic protein thiol--disulfide oxidoreductase DsbE [Actinobacillus delphinicola]
MKKRYIPLVLFLLIAIAFFVQLLRNEHGDDPRALESALVGQPMPASNLQGLWGKHLNYNELFKNGKPVLVNVWATWCPTCFAEHQFLDELAKSGVPIVGVDYKDGVEAAREWLHTYGNPYKAVINDGNGVLGLDLGIYGTPETFLVDGKGIIRYRWTGNLDADGWKNTLGPLYEKYKAEGDHK